MSASWRGHGYTYECAVAELEEMAAAVAPRSYMWYKIFVLRRALERLLDEQQGSEGEAYLVWVDADAVIVPPPGGSGNVVSSDTSDQNQHLNFHAILIISHASSGLHKVPLATCNSS